MTEDIYKKLWFSFLEYLYNEEDENLKRKEIMDIMEDDELEALRDLKEKNK